MRCVLWFCWLKMLPSQNKMLFNVCVDQVYAKQRLICGNCLWIKSLNQVLLCFKWMAKMIQRTRQRTQIQTQCSLNIVHGHFNANVNAFVEQLVKNAQMCHGISFWPNLNLLEIWIKWNHCILQLALYCLLCECSVYRPYSRNHEAVLNRKLIRFTLEYLGTRLKFVIIVYKKKENKQKEIK